MLQSLEAGYIITWLLRWRGSMTSTFLLSGGASGTIDKGQAILVECAEVTIAVKGPVVTFKIPRIPAVICTLL